MYLIPKIYVNDYVLSDHCKELRKHLRNRGQGTRPLDIPLDIVEIAPSLDPSLNAMYAGKKLIQEAWGYWADDLGKLVKKKQSQAFKRVNRNGIVDPDKFL